MLPFQFIKYRSEYKNISIIDLLGVQPNAFLFEFPESLNTLVQYGWIQRREYAYRMHPLLQDIILHKFNRKFNSNELAVKLTNCLGVSMLDKPYDKLNFFPFAARMLHISSADKSYLAILSNKLSAVFILLNDFEHALHYQHISFKYKKHLNKVNPNPISMSFAYANFALIYKGLGRMQKCEDALNKDLRHKELAGEINLNLAKSYNTSALFYEDIGQYKKALEFHRKSIVIREKLIDESDTNVELYLYLATAYNNIALSLLADNQIEEAYTYQTASINIRQAHLKDKYHPSFSQSFGNYAEILFAKGDFSGAISYNVKAIRIYLKEQPDSIALAACLNSFAIVLLSVGKVEQARKIVKESIHIRRKKLSPGNFLLARSYKTYADVFLAKKEYRKAIFYITEAIAMVILLRKRHPELKKYVETQKKIAVYLV